MTRWTLLDPQGWEVDDPESEGWLVDWGLRDGPSTPDIRACQPGVAEAMVLAGVVSARRWAVAYQPWVAVETP